jgi:hypothetical protein
MSKKIRYPNGFIGHVSDAAAEVLAQRPGHAIVLDRPGAPPIENTPATIEAARAEINRNAELAARS